MISPPQEWTPAPDAPLRDQLSISTPELVEIEFPLAGIGSRFVAILLDYLIQAFAAAVIIILMVILFSGMHSSGVSSRLNNMGEKWAIAFVILLPFLFQWGYFALFEAFWHGQTPGKRVMHIRVIQQTGRPAGLFESLGRNLLRIIDMLPTMYIIGVIFMFVTKRQQRLGDLLAGTLVVHERSMEPAAEFAGSARTFTAESFQQTSAPVPRHTRLPADAVALLSIDDLHALESYLHRRIEVPMDIREKLASRLATNLARKMQIEVPDGMSREAFLEETAFSLRGVQTLRRGL